MDIRTVAPQKKPGVTVAVVRVAPTADDGPLAEFRFAVSDCLRNEAIDGIG